MRDYELSDWPNTICAEKAFREQTTDTLKRTCTFECHKELREMENDDRLPLIQEIGYREFIITAIKEELYVAHGNNVSEKVDINKNIPGSYRIKIACSSKLIQVTNKGSVTLIHSSTPCFEKDQKLEIVHVIAGQWWTIPESIIQKTLDSKHEFANINKIFDENWKKNSFTQELQTEMDFENKVKDISMRNTVDTIYGIGFYTNIIAVAISTIMGGIAAFTIFQLRRIKRELENFKSDQKYFHSLKNNSPFTPHEGRAGDHEGPSGGDVPIHGAATAHRLSLAWRASSPLLRSSNLTNSKTPFSTGFKWRKEVYTNLDTHMVSKTTGIRW